MLRRHGHVQPLVPQESKNLKSFKAFSLSLSAHPCSEQPGAWAAGREHNLADDLN